MTVRFSVDELSRLAAQGMTDNLLAAHFGVSARTILRWRKRHDIRNGWVRPVAQHGLASSYSKKNGCRCGLCTEAHRERVRRETEKRRIRTAAGLMPPTVRHGRAATASNWGCKCGPCTEAVRIRNAADSARRKAVNA